MEKLVDFKNKGEKLFGVLHYPETLKKIKVPCVVMYHGFTGSRTEAHFLFTKLARKLAKRGIAVLRFDFRGSGDSEGSFSDMTVEEELSDAKAALDFIKTQKNIATDRLGILGLSMGGFVGSYTAGQYPGIKSVVLMSAVARFWSLWRKLLVEGTGRAGGPVMVGGIKLSKNFITAIKKYDGLNLKSIVDYVNPLLVIHGAKDPVVPVEDGELYHAVSASYKKKIVIIENAGHTFESKRSEEKAIKLAASWCRETL